MRDAQALLKRVRTARVFLFGLIFAVSVVPALVKAQAPSQSLFEDQGGASRPIQLDRVVFQGGRSQVIGRHGFGLGCLSTHSTLQLSSGKVKVEPSVYAEIFHEVLGAANFTVVGDTGALFQDRDADRAEFLVGGLVKDLKVDICDSFGKVNKSGKSSMNVEWQVYSPIQRQVVYTTATSGDAKVKAQPNGGIVALNTAFTQAASGLINDQGFNDLVFTQSSGDSIADSAPSDATSIPAVALRTGSFQDDVTLTRARVATIVTGGGSGSGYFIAKNLLLTNEHVVGGSSIVVVKLVTGRELVGEVVATNSARDVALLQTESLGLEGLPLQMSQPQVGDRVFVIGSPMDEDLESTVSAGIVSAFRSLDGLRYIQSDTNVLPGNSGGPMFDEQGNVIAMTVAGMFGAGSGLNLFIPIAEALKALNIEPEDG